MGRAWRIEYPGALYHVLSRGNERREIFFSHSDRYMFLNILGEMSDRFAVEIYAYVLMPNHYHLLVRTQEANLSKCMQWLGVTYTNRVNIRYGRSGHLFQGRFKAMLVENEAYLMQLSCYIHRNPIRAGLVKRLSDYRWSSYLRYAYGQKSPAWLSTDLVLSLFNVEDRQRAYREKVKSYVHEEKLLWEDFRHGLFLGSLRFVDEMRGKYLAQGPHREIPQQRATARLEDPEKLLEKTARVFGCDTERFRQSERISSSDREDRDILVYFLWQTGRVTNERLGELFGVTYSAISHIVKGVKDQLIRDPRSREKIAKLHSQFKI
jgi:REP element-mobilizing transposase RayT